MENWKDVKDYEGLYLVSDCGRVMSLPKVRVTKNRGMQHHDGKILKAGIVNGYQRVVLCKEGNKNFLVHRLVAENFIKNNDLSKQVNHIDGNKLNNMVENLEWCSPSENIQHAVKNGLKKDAKRVIDKQTCVEYNSIREAAKLNGLDGSHLRRMLIGEYANKTSLKII